MNRLTIIGRLTRNPEQRTTQSGIQVTTFTVAVNRRKGQNEQEPEADFFKVTAWRGLADVCGRYLQKGYRVAVTGPVGLDEWQERDGQNKAQMTITAEAVEILTSKAEATGDIMTAQQRRQDDQREADYRRQEREAIQNEPKYVEVDPGDDLPF